MAEPEHEETLAEARATDRRTAVSTAQQVATAYDALVDAAGRLVKISGGLLTDARILRAASRGFALIALFLFALACFLQWQLVIRDDKIEDLERTVAQLDADVARATAAAERAEAASIEAKTASERTSGDLADALTRASGGPDPAIAEALAKIDELYQACVARTTCG